MKISSSAFENNKKIPSIYTCDGSNINPPLQFEGVPQNAKSLALIVDDPDAPMGTWVHWILFNLSPDVTGIDENSIPKDAIEGITSFGKKGYGGPCPPSGTHRYFFKLYAFDSSLDLSEKATKEDLKKAMQDHILAQAEFIGLYARR